MWKFIIKLHFRKSFIMMSQRKQLWFAHHQCDELMVQQWSILVQGMRRSHHLHAHRKFEVFIRDFKCLLDRTHVLTTFYPPTITRKHERARLSCPFALRGALGIRKSIPPGSTQVRIINNPNNSNVAKMKAHLHQRYWKPEVWFDKWSQTPKKIWTSIILRLQFDHYFHLIKWLAESFIPIPNGLSRYAWRNWTPSRCENLLPSTHRSCHCIWWKLRIARSQQITDDLPGDLFDATCSRNKREHYTQSQRIGQPNEFTGNVSIELFDWVAQHIKHKMRKLITGISNWLWWFVSESPIQQILSIAVGLEQNNLVRWDAKLNSQRVDDWNHRLILKQREQPIPNRWRSNCRSRRLLFGVRTFLELEHCSVVTICTKLFSRWEKFAHQPCNLFGSIFPDTKQDWNFEWTIQNQMKPL